MNSLDSLIARIRGQDPEAEELQRQKAEASIAKQEAYTGEKYQEETPLAEDEVTNTVVDSLSGGTSGIMRRLGSAVTGKATSGALDKLKEKGPPSSSKPTFHEAVVGGRKPGVVSFSKFVRGDNSDRSSSKTGSIGKPETPLTKNPPRKEEKTLTSYERGSGPDNAQKIRLDNLRAEREIEYGKKTLDKKKIAELDKEISRQFGPRFK